MLQHLVISDCLFVAKIAYSAVFEIGLSKRIGVEFDLSGSSDVIGHVTIFDSHFQLAVLEPITQAYNGLRDIQCANVTHSGTINFSYYDFL